MEVCDCFVDLIDQHNEQIDLMNELGKELLKAYPDVEQTYVNDVFCAAMDNLFEQSIQMCAMANCVDDVAWYTDENMYVFTEGESAECDCDYTCDCPKMSKYLS